MSTLFKIPQWRFKFFPSSKLGKLYIISSFFTSLAIILSLVLATRVYMIQDVRYNVPLKGNSTTTKIVIVTHYIDIDAIAGTMTTDWYPLTDNCQSPEEVVNIYFDRNVLISPGPDPNQIVSDQPSDQPIFQFNTKTRCGGSVRDSHATFRVVAKLVGQGSRSKWTGPSLQWYPLDIYFSQFSLFAQLNSTKANVGIITNTPFGSPLNFRVNLDQKLSRNTDQGLYIRLDIRRSGAVRLLVMIIVFANWLASIAFLWITVASLLWPEKVVKEMFVIPIAALFAFTSVRSSMPGAPAGFGAFMDFIGILPNLASMGIFSATLLFVILLRRTRSVLQDQDDESVYARGGRVEQQKRAPIPVLDHDSIDLSGREKVGLSPIDDDNKPALKAEAGESVYARTGRVEEQKGASTLELDDSTKILVPEKEGISATNDSSHVVVKRGDDANGLSPERA